ncbi:hypothetical protein QBC46DRAFT_309806 [Diplogelasinospora grovesii]|uniref:RAD52 homolog n=1 Tax=Diplogelasinospora grovesii TaxID=303347 RepID=A0AAN6NAS4_9PEZI|nr:hypothetical protein QBC46DRAFT_309806 [Diplogelasinospora grovesii]
MPAPGDQHNRSIANPFEEPQKRISEYTAQEIASLQSRLEKQLGPEYISARSGPSGQKVHYIAAEKCIALANEVFGFNGWSSSIQNIQVDFVDEHPQTLKISLGLSVIVRVTLRDGTFHEDIGYGHIENCKGKAAAFEKAKKEGTTDALKRALRNFGNVLGNCIYDKAYLAKVTKMKVEPTKFDVDGLHRHQDYAVKKEEADKPDVPSIPQLTSVDSFEDLLGELDEADFNMTEDGHPDEVVLPTSNSTSSNETPQNKHQGANHNNNNNTTHMQPPPRPLQRAGSGGSSYASRQQQQPHTPNHNQPPRNQFNGGNQNHGGYNGGQRPPQQQQNQFNQNRPQSFNNGQNHNGPNHSGPNQNNQAHMTPPHPQATGQNNNGGPPPGVETVGFFSARAVKELPEESLSTGAVAPKEGLAFNPRLESPSIRKTPGIDHTKSKPLARNGQHVPPPTSTQSGATSGPGAGLPSSTPGKEGGGGGGFGRPGGGPAMGGGVGGGMGMARGNVINPQLDSTRRIGAPGAASPLANRGQYRPPTMKRPVPGDNAGGQPPGRAPLTDVSNNAPTVNTNSVGGGSGPDVKRQRVG